ncbi:MAG: glycosyltransferase [Butyrivibrio sp.]|uniref:glycosyltransferase n=1 Tax=Butyrivibrio sp. TaxID=28121 RepID=UPI0025C61D40|nr:glycosyltransferase [Butyrivibrio sp.]MBQ6588709.1 glycosyltransferase [Butyrivibrio sp.]
MDINILFPVLNEHLRLEKGIDKCVAYMRENVHIPYKLTIVDNGSDDDTPEIGRRLAAKYDEVEYVRIEERGVGIAFKTGVLRCEADIVGYMDIDLSTDLEYLSKTIEIFEKKKSVQYVNGSRFSKDSKTHGRKWYRKITSAGLVFILKAMFQMKATDALCGFTFLRTPVAQKLVKMCSDDKGWFYTVELLLRAERTGVNIVDMPIEWVEDYDTTVNVPKTIKNYIIRIYKLKKMFRQEKRYATVNR